MLEQHEFEKDRGIYAFELNAREIEAVQVARQQYLMVRGLLDDSAMPPDKPLEDEFGDRSVWLGVGTPQDHSHESTGRIILPTHGDILSLQMSLHNIREPDQELVQYLLDRPAHDVAEVASMLQIGDNPWANLYLDAALHNASRARGINFWLFGLRARNKRFFEKVFGPALHSLGKGVSIKGAKEELVPYLIDLGPGVARIRHSLDHGVEDRFTKRTRQTLIEAIDTIQIVPKDAAWPHAV